MRTRSIRRSRRRPFTAALAVVGLASALVATPVSAAPEPGTPVVVNSTGNAIDNNIGDGACDTGRDNSAGQPECTLHAAIRETNRSGADHIHFNIPTSDPGYDGSRWRNSVSDTLPSIGLDTEVEGNTQPGFGGTPVIELHNTGNASTGIRFSSASGGSLEYLSITNFTSHGIELSNADNMRKNGNHVGITPSGSADGNGGSGVHLTGGSTNNVIANNVIGANSGNGLTITGGSARSAIDGNSIGIIGPSDFGNAGHGIHVLQGSDDTTIGTTAGNVVSFNGADGIRLQSIQRTQVLGNTIGSNSLNRQRGPNDGHGLLIESGATATIGSVTRPNVIVTNELSGIAVLSATADIVGNFIGTNADGLLRIGNRGSGVLVVDSGAGNRVVDNVIQNNVDDGVTVRSQNVLISRNSFLDNLDQ